ncbi:helix-turn-helix domain-containing protein [Streptomyces johnsoniae]|uniref:Helix-turn-helix domain-containing protein n=1 Tax=Streptomyces johnsoniae TaxID=3075532 RepID=A0ABU2S9K6_9ACTN|nr:helix-turn-helix domain-containing protein [Streptomyces sp. DSM 41886]MDT0445597.1 helix-turn-helix domain-containing protein [Streptomyces sp. DSM 41886]
MGRRLRELRTERGLSLSELARRSGLGKATLSELESGRRNPTLETLYALTTALRTHLTAVLAPATEHAEFSGSAVNAVLLERYQDEDATTEAFRVRIRAGAIQESPAHLPGTTERIVVLGGTARVGAVGAPSFVGPGEHAEWAGDVPHLYSAPDGDVDALLIVRYPHPGHARRDEKLLSERAANTTVESDHVRDIPG